MSKVREKARVALYGVGINDADYKTRRNFDIEGNKINATCPYYSAWSNMLRRCYDLKYQDKNPRYKGCTVCDHWLLFSNFTKWMCAQDWAGKELDKDIKGDLLGNKIYSPNTCLFVTHKINTVVAIGSKCVSKRPERKNYEVYCKNPFIRSTNGYVGCYSTEEEAKIYYFKTKAKYLITTLYSMELNYYHEKEVRDSLITLVVNMQKNFLTF